MRVQTRFYADLNDFLPRDRRGVAFTADVALGTTVKDLVESLGIPHTEVDVVLVNGMSVGFGHQLQDGDRMGVYPGIEDLDVAPLIRLRPTPLREPRFVLDVHLGRLARHLRLLGFDTRWRNDTSDEDLVRISLQDHRILLTRDRGLLKRRAVVHGYFVRETGRRDQTLEVLRRFELFDAIEPFSRCLECNGRLEHAGKGDVEDDLPERTRSDFDEFRRCPDCGRVYWQGSHFDRLRAVVDEIRASGPGVGSPRETRGP